MRVNGRTAIVAGVAPPGFVGAMQLVAADLWLPAAMYPDLERYRAVLDEIDPDGRMTSDMARRLAIRKARA